MGMINWKYDESGEQYFIINSGDYHIEVFEDVTTIFKHPLEHQRLDHIFVEVTPEADQGFFIWRKLVEKALGDGSFDDITDEMADRGYAIAFMSEPEPGDIKAWEKNFGDYRPDFTPVHEDYIAKSMYLIDMAWKYYQPEWKEEFGL